MNNRLLLVCLAGLALQLNALPPAAAQKSEKRWIKHQINMLASPSMGGRGYVDKGGEKAANYLRRQFSEFGLLPFTADSSYFQPFNFPVNTFPGAMYLKLQRKEMNPGEDYIVHAASKRYFTEKIRSVTINLKKVKDSVGWNKIKSRLRPDRAYILKNSDTVAKYIYKNPRKFARDLPEGLFIIPQHGKLTWTVSTDTIPASIFYVEDTVMPKRIRNIEARLETRFLPSYKSNNVAAFVPGRERPDSFILFTAHFDHLGKMGKQTVFPGAHDNASGTALMLYLAQHFARNPQRYSIGFIGFSGEEAGLLGSDYYTERPFFPLEKIRFVVNMDMTGDATHGITVVNATEQKAAFSLLRQINDGKGYLPQIAERGQTQNSDHYPFSEKGVPAIFIYGNGTKAFYHDVFDKAKEISLENIDKLALLLKDFTAALQLQ